MCNLLLLFINEALVAFKQNQKKRKKQKKLLLINKVTNKSIHKARDVSLSFLSSNRYNIIIYII